MVDIRRGFVGAVSPFLLQRLLLPPLENAYSTPETRAFVRQMRRQYAGLEDLRYTGYIPAHYLPLLPVPINEG